MKKFWFYFLTFTWGLPMTIIGGFAVLVLGLNPIRKYGYCWVYQFGRNWGGISLGPIIITSTPYVNSLMNHEHGHAIQNCWFGPFFPFVVGIPSVVRYWWREYLYKKGSKDLPDYDAVWFEGNATRLGTKFMSKYFGGLYEK